MAEIICTLCRAVLKRHCGHCSWLDCRKCGARFDTDRGLLRHKDGTVETLGS